MAIEIQYHGLLAEISGKPSEFLDISGSVSVVLKSVTDMYPEMRNISFVIAHNGIVSHQEAEMQPGDNLALIPPAPGG